MDILSAFSNSFPPMVKLPCSLPAPQPPPLQATRGETSTSEAYLSVCVRVLVRISCFCRCMDENAYTRKYLWLSSKCKKCEKSWNSVMVHREDRMKWSHLCLEQQKEMISWKQWERCRVECLYKIVHIIWNGGIFYIIIAIVFVLIFLFSCVSDSLRHHGLWPARVPLSPGILQVGMPEWVAFSLQADLPNWTPRSTQVSPYCSWFFLLLPEQPQWIL